MAALAGKLADLYMASGTSTTFSAVAMTDSGDHETYTTTTAAHRYWDDTATTTIEVSTDSGDTWADATAGDFAVQYVGGIVTFTTVDADREVRATGKYFTIAQVGQAYDWEISPSVNILDQTVFGDSWKNKIAGIFDATAKASRYFLDGTFFDLLGSKFVMIFYPHFSTGERFEAYAFLKSDPMKVGVDAVITEELDFEISGVLYYLAS